MLEPGSRYDGVEDAELTVTTPEGDERVVRYKRRRLLEPPGGAALTEHTVAPGERLDHLAARYLGDPTRYWQLCDANLLFHPRELEEAGRVVTVALRIP